MTYHAKRKGGFDAPLSVRYIEVRAPRIRYVDEAARNPRSWCSYELDEEREREYLMRALTEPEAPFDAMLGSQYKLVMHDPVLHQNSVWHPARSFELPEGIEDACTIELEVGALLLFGWWERIVYVVWKQWEPPSTANKTAQNG